MLITRVTVEKMKTIRSARLSSGARLPAISRYNNAIEFIARRMRAKCLIVVSNLVVVTWVGVALDEDRGEVALEFSHC